MDGKKLNNIKKEGIKTMSTNINTSKLTYEQLQKQLLNACFNKYTPATNKKRISKIAAQLRYMEGARK